MSVGQQHLGLIWVVDAPERNYVDVHCFFDRGYRVSGVSQRNRHWGYHQRNAHPACDIATYVIKQARASECDSKSLRIIQRVAARDELIQGESHSDGVIIADGLSYRSKNIQDDSYSVLRATSILITAAIGIRR